MLSREEYSEIVSRFVGNDTSDEALTTVKNMMETYDELSSSSELDKIREELRDKKEKYEELKKEYIKAFLSGPRKDVEETVEEETVEEEEEEDKDNPKDYSLV